MGKVTPCSDGVSSCVRGQFHDETLTPGHGSQGFDFAAVKVVAYGPGCKRRAALWANYACGIATGRAA